MKTVVVIPSRNESKHIKAVVSRLVILGYPVVVSDDNSTDATGEIACSNGAMVVKSSHEKHGYGSALKAGIIAAKKLYNPEILVFMDGDGQHSPKDIRKVLYPIIRDQADVVLGSRLGNQDHRPLYRRLSNAFGTSVVNVGSDQKVTDAITGYWAIRTKCLPEITEMGWGATFELLAKIKRIKPPLRIVSVPIRAIWHKKSSDNSTANALILGLIVLWKIAKWRLIKRESI